ncbi:transposase [Treponema primitia]|uniref:REP-associated tyrosine transposase n=1 Tax=Treponema primitia TaxID=88058 RepID=UPI003980DC23
MRKKREFVERAVYHVTSRTNDKQRLFRDRLGKKIMLMTLRNAKDRFGFSLFNFCIMPNHIHLLIWPSDGGDLSRIMHWVKTNSSKWYNGVRGRTGHLWGNRYFAREIQTPEDYYAVMGYIDRNPVKAGLVPLVGDWEESGAYHIQHRLTGLVDYDEFTELLYARQLLLPDRRQARF